MSAADLFLTSEGIRNVPGREVGLWLMILLPELTARPKISKKNGAVTWCVVTPACQKDSDRLSRTRLHIKEKGVLVRASRRATTP
jgi:hypothetical protein